MDLPGMDELNNPKPAITADSLLDSYIDFVLTQGKRPANVYLFAKENGLEEQEFYRFYSGFSQMEREFLREIFRRTVELCTKDENYFLLSAKERLLNFYFIFVENLTLNRSFVLFLLENGRHSSDILLGIKSDFLTFTESLPLQQLPMMEKFSANLQEVSYRSQKEVLWKHFLAVVVFWRRDSSPQFEKTDLFIEKSVDAGFTLADVEPIKKVLDLGKFLWKEKFLK